MKVNKVTVEAALDDWKEDREYEQDIKPELIKKWANDIAQKVSTDEQMVHSIALMQVRDYRTTLPENFKFINQVAYNIETTKPILKEQLVEWVQKADNGCDVKVTLDCPDCLDTDTECSRPIATVDVNAIWASANPQTQVAYAKFFYGYGGTSIRDGSQGCWTPPSFQLMRPSQNSFFNIPFHEDACMIGVDQKAEYQVHPPVLITNFKTGQILLSYMGADIDDEGWYYIPNLPEVFEAISFGVDEKIARMKYSKNPTSQTRTYWMDMRSEKERMIARAKNKLQIPSADEWVVLMQNHYNRLHPYWDYEQNLNRDARDRYKQPNETYNWTR